MAENYGWAGKVLRVDLSTGAITTESTDKYKAYLGGTGLGWKVLWDEVPPETKAWDAANRLVFAVGPLTGGGSPCSGRTSIVTRWPVNSDELPAAGHFGGHWGPELKYAGYDGVIVQGKAAKPVWLRIEDDKVTLEDAAEIWGEGIYHSTNYIEAIMGSEAHVAAIGPAGENLVRMAAVFTDRSHRAGGVGSVMGSKNLKAVAVRGTGAMKIKADKKAWKELNRYYLSLMGANNQCVVARDLQPWSEFSPGGTRWSGAPGILWGAAQPPVNTGTCPDLEHPAIDAPNPLNKIALRTAKGYNDFGTEGMRRTVKQDGCHACPIRCHIAADHPELQSYGLNRYNMNTCMGNGGNAWYTNTAGANAVTNTMLLAYMANNLEGDYGIWNDYGGWFYAFKWLYLTPNAARLTLGPANIAGLARTGTGATALVTVTTDVAHPFATADSVTVGGASVDFPGGTFAVTRVDATHFTYTQAGAVTTEGNTGRTASALIPVLRKYLSLDEWTRLRTTVLAGFGKSPFDLLDAGDPRWLQFIIPAVSANVPGTLGALIGQGPSWLATQMPELKAAMDTDASLHMIKMGHTSHHGIETNGQLGGLINAVSAVRDANNHSHQNYYGNGLPNSATNPLQRDIAQELTTKGVSIFNAPDESASGAWAWDLKGTNTPMNAARAAFVAQSLIWYELQNCLTECNYTLPIWASPLKSRNYRGDPTLNAQVLSAITGVTVTHKELETIGLRVFTLLRALTARYMQHANAGTGANMRANFDLMNEWQFKPLNTSVTGLVHADWEVAKDLLYDQLGWDRTTGFPSATKLTELGLGDLVPTLQTEGVLPA